MASKEAALVALKALLETITVANGYTLNVALVTRQFKAIDAIPTSSFPCLIIEDDGQEEVFHKTGGSSGLADMDIDVNIIGYINHKDNVSTDLNELEAALIKAIYSDVELGGAVGNMAMQPVKERSGSKFNPYGFFVRPIKLFYEIQLSNGL